MNVAIIAESKLERECPQIPPRSGVDFVLIRPGATVLDELGCIKGDLDVPLSENGRTQVAEMAGQLRRVPFAVVYSSPCSAALETAQRLAEESRARVKIDEDLRNLDHGLWQGKRFDELRTTQPRIYRMWADAPDKVSPPGGETMELARTRAAAFVRRVQQRYRHSIVGVVACEPLLTILRNELCLGPLEDFWHVERRAVGWECVHRAPNQLGPNRAADGNGE